MADGSGSTGGGPASPRRGRAPGWREVLIIAAIIVLSVLGADVLTAVLPAEARGVVTNTPLLIAVLILGTTFVLWRIAARKPPPP